MLSAAPPPRWRLRRVAQHPPPPHLCAMYHLQDVDEVFAKYPELKQASMHRWADADDYNPRNSGCSDTTEINLEQLWQCGLRWT